MNADTISGHPVHRFSPAIASLALILLVMFGIALDAQGQIPPPPADSVALRGAMEELVRIRESGGWRTLPVGSTLRLGDRDDRVILLRARLRLTGDLEAPAGLPEASTADPALFDEYLDGAVRRFQARHALEVDGVVGPATRGALNVPVEARIRQISLNLERRREFVPSPRSGPFHILVNIPGFQAYVLEEGEPPRVHRVIVGRVDRPTPLLTSRIENVVLSPYWNVPLGILAKDKLPEIRRDPSYLARSRISVIDRATGQVVDPSRIDWTGTAATAFNARYLLRQAPGPGNALGVVKFIFPNSYDVFLHDTSDPHLFERGKRAFSSGCMRLDGAMELAERLLARDPAWGVERIRAVARGGVEVWVPLTDPVPIQTVYWTAWVASDGTLNLVDDLYGIDAQRSVAMLEDGMSECFVDPGRRIAWQ